MKEYLFSNMMATTCSIGELEGDEGGGERDGVEEGGTLASPSPTTTTMKRHAHTTKQS